MSVRVLYIGQFTDGTTSKMRGETLRDILNPTDFQVIDTHLPFFQTLRVWRSLGFRFKKGPLIRGVNKFIRKRVYGNYDLIWIDKGVFIKESTTQFLKSRGNCLVHYTPDTAFFENESSHFYKSIKWYDWIISTKSFEREHYLKLIDPKSFILIPQGFDKQVHYPRVSFQEKENYVVFIGLFEPSRGEILRVLLDNGIRVKLAGKKWDSFLNSHTYENLEFLGDSLLKDEYALTISKAFFGLGLLSKRFPELHTTRTFEIPACGTLLVTEKNSEIEGYFDDGAVLYFSDYKELLENIKQLAHDTESLKEMTLKGHDIVHQCGLDYESQLKKICSKIGFVK
ncbi:CgeB family protein [Mangrovimonas futianensis]|uniref:CgeB family protein n=1 Tax=Mangrovimonas futianensis TaxID=2895523 RepID=UPI001E4C4A1E|nr:glycosyltransferase [Mangrovimonas futianensis]MCF1420244.1 glycosyltransferase [Mangrovimonas futianensis]